jgi:uncharacterized protein YjbJ (UPF0337 family)
MTEKDAKQQVSGSVKEALGKITGDDAVAAEGRAEKASGKAEAAEHRGQGPTRK